MSKNNKELKKTKPKKWYKGKRMVGIIFLILAVGVAVLEIDNFLENNHNEGQALTACQAVYSKKINRFSNATGLTAGNVVFNKPQVTKERNLYIFSFNNIVVGNQKDYFVCYYNIKTEKATDRTPEPNFNDGNSN
jgi:hypothetical protein|tara:strand:- start:29217 stop:29621 length:405 start_codon:yes stop_codon:yes gene_type:complete